jgi:methyl-accepting chemotaxis protein
MTQLNQITQQNASSSEELAATSEEMSAQAESLKDLMAFFTTSNQARKVTARIQEKAKASIKMPAVSVAAITAAGRAAKKGNGSAEHLAASFTNF